MWPVPVKCERGAVDEVGLDQFRVAEEDDVPAAGAAAAVARGVEPGGLPVEVVHGVVQLERAVEAG